MSSVKTQKSLSPAYRIKELSKKLEMAKQIKKSSMIARSRINLSKLRPGGIKATTMYGAMSPAKRDSDAILIEQQASPGADKKAASML